MKSKLFSCSHEKKTHALSQAVVACALAFSAVIVIEVVILSTEQANDDSKELLLLHLVMRHGKRTPVRTYPKDPYINHTFYPIGWGQLTNEGKMELYNMGKFLKERYRKFLGDHYSPEEYYTQSTDSDRTKASLQLVNAGLWPPPPEQKWGPLDGQPIPVYAEPLDQDTLLLVRQPCPQYHIEREKLMNSEEIQEKFKKAQPLFEELTEKTGNSISNFDEVMSLFNTLKAEEAFNLTLPDWTKDYYPDKMFGPTIFSFVLNAYNDKINRFKGGVLLKKFMSDWQGKIDGTIKPKQQKAFLYGGHDATIVSLLSALKVWDPQLPDYGIMILLEFSKDKNRNVYGLEVFLWNSTSVPPYQLTIPGCDRFCPIEKLTEITKNVIPINWEEECKSDDSSYMVPDPSEP